MNADDANRNGRYFDTVAPTYDEQLSSVPRNNWVRDAFRSLVVENVPSGSLLLDFGCGTGTDALWYVEHGYRVIAYDSSAGMIEQLRTKCELQIARGEIIPYHLDYEAFLERELRPQPTAVVSNFAVLSVVSDLPRLCAAFARHVAARGHVIVSILNPFFWEDMVHRWWWKACIHSLGKGSIDVVGSGPATRRYFPASLTAAASPYFMKIDQAGVGAFVDNHTAHHWSEPKSLRERMEHRLWKKRLFRNLGQFTFFVYRRCSRED